jgi:hypothetical protein
MILPKCTPSRYLRTVFCAKSGSAFAHTALILTLLSVALALFTSRSMAQSESDQLPESLQKDFPMPPVLVGFSRKKVTDFESDKAGLGYGISYSRSLYQANIFIYDLGIKSIPLGPKSDIVKNQLECATQDINNAGYTDVKAKNTFETHNTAGKPVFSCIQFQLTLREPSDSFLCITGAANKIVKVRVSVAHTASSEETSKRFISELADIIPQR